MTYEELVEKVRTAYGEADASSLTEHVAFQFNIEGEAAGAFYLEIADGKVNVEPYEYFDRDVLVTTSAATLLEIAEGKLDPVKAFLLGKIKAQGNLGKAAFLKELSAGQEKKSSKKPDKKAEEADKAAVKDVVKADKTEAKAEGVKAEAEKEETVKAAGARAEKVKTEVVKPETAKSESVRLESVKTAVGKNAKKVTK